MLIANELNGIKFDERGLVPAVVQEITTKEVLMVAYMNQEALEKTLDTKETWFWSRSRGALWHKGATSGNLQTLKGLYYDCDGDTLLVLVQQQGVACHTGERSCFFNEMYQEQNPLPPRDGGILFVLDEIIKDRKRNPKEGSYTNYLFDKGLDKILKKVGEETAEVIIAAKNPQQAELVYETSDLIYHLLVLLNEREVPLEDVLTELAQRR